MNAKNTAKKFFVIFLLLVLLPAITIAATNNNSKPAEITTPVNRTNLTSDAVTFRWNSGTNVAAYKLQVGSFASSKKDIYYGTETNTTSTEVTDMPTDGRTVYIRLWSKIDGSWENYRDYTYTTLKKPPKGTNSFLTGGDKIMLAHKPTDEYLYYQCPKNEVAYTAQIVKAANDLYYTVYHAEPRKSKMPFPPGDSIKAGIRKGSFDYRMPEDKKYILWCSTTDTGSVIYSSDNPADIGKFWKSWGGAGNPMVVKAPTDDYYYIQFVAVTDPELDRENEADFSIILCQARTKDFRNIQLRTEYPKGNICWMDWDAGEYSKRPKPLQDNTGRIIGSQRPTYMNLAEGLLGSTCYYQGKYYHFYSDIEPNNQWFLFYRWTDKIDQLTEKTDWSPAMKTNLRQTQGKWIKVAIANDMDRWCIIYYGQREDDKKDDILIQYTENMNIMGKGGISDIVFFSKEHGFDKHYLGSHQTGYHYQQYFMTDPTGRLAAPDDKPQNATTGGLVTWTDHSMGVYGGRVLCGGWDLYVPQATNPTPADSSESPTENTLLKWDAGYKATSYNIYFGETNPPPMKANQVETTFVPEGLSPSKTYYWRVDAINGDDGYITEGKIWSFTTK